MSEKDFIEISSNWEGKVQLERLRRSTWPKQT